MRLVECACVCVYTYTDTQIAVQLLVNVPGPVRFKYAKNNSKNA